MTTNKVLFLDIDGPMIPIRAFILPFQDTGNPTWFDPIAVVFINKLLDEDPTLKLVISSARRGAGTDEVRRILAKNGMDPRCLHDDWCTPVKLTGTRGDEIQWWLDDHPEVTHHVAVDDIAIDGDVNSVRVTLDDGISRINMLEIRSALEILGNSTKSEMNSNINTMKSFELRKHDMNSAELREIADELYPKGESLILRV